MVGAPQRTVGLTDDKGATVSSTYLVVCTASTSTVGPLRLFFNSIGLVCSSDIAHEAKLRSGSANGDLSKPKRNNEATAPRGRNRQGQRWRSADKEEDQGQNEALEIDFVKGGFCPSISSVPGPTITRVFFRSRLFYHCAFGLPESCLWLLSFSNRMRCTSTLPLSPPPPPLAPIQPGKKLGRNAHKCHQQ